MKEARRVCVCVCVENMVGYFSCIGAWAGETQRRFEAIGAPPSAPFLTLLISLHFSMSALPTHIYETFAKGQAKVNNAGRDFHTTITGNTYNYWSLAPPPQHGESLAPMCSCAILTERIALEAFELPPSSPHYCPICGVYHERTPPRQTPEHDAETSSTGIALNRQPPAVTTPRVEPRAQDGDSGNAKVHDDGSIRVGVGTAHSNMHIADY